MHSAFSNLGMTSPVLAAPMAVSAGVQVVLELFDKAGEFTEDDRRLVAAAADFGAEMLRQALAERQTQRVLFDAVEAALGASDSMAASLRGAAARPDDPTPSAVLEQLKEGLSANAGPDAGETLRLKSARLPRSCGAWLGAIVPGPADGNDAWLRMIGVLSKASTEWMR